MIEVLSSETRTRSVLLYLAFRGSTARHLGCQTEWLEREIVSQRGDEKSDSQKDQDRKQLIFKHQDSGGDQSGEENGRWRQKRKQSRES